MAAEIDLTILSEACGGNRAVIGAAMRLFVATTRNDLARLRPAIAMRDAAASNAVAHRIKGAARVIGAPGIVRAAQAIETAADGEGADWPAVMAAEPLLTDAFSAIEAYIAAAFPA